jgi:hypothetical protein
MWRVFMGSDTIASLEGRAKMEQRTLRQVPFNLTCETLSLSCEDGPYSKSSVVYTIPGTAATLSTQQLLLMLPGSAEAMSVEYFLEHEMGRNEYKQRVREHQQHEVHRS